MLIFHSRFSKRSLTELTAAVTVHSCSVRNLLTEFESFLIRNVRMWVTGSKPRLAAFLLALAFSQPVALW